MYMPSIADDDTTNLIRPSRCFAGSLRKEFVLFKGISTIMFIIHNLIKICIVFFGGARAVSDNSLLSQLNLRFG